MKYVILKNTVGGREHFQRTRDAHSKYLESLNEEGQLLLAGSFEDHSGGMLLVEADGPEQAISIARSDPMVAAGVDRYLVRGWNQTFDAAEPEDDDSQQMKLPLKHIDTGPIQLPPAAENFRVIEVEEHPRQAELVTRCFAPDQIAPDDPARRGYLRRAGDNGLRKLLLLHHNVDEVAGQIEFAPPGASGLPISGEDLTVINCLWVTDTYTGLDGGRHLLAACAQRAGTRALATIGYNATLPWLNRGFFERQGFNLLDQVETGRFFGNTAITAYLLWRPLVSGTAPPTWDTESLLEGVSFCPGYPWMFGKRRYWGHDFAYHGTVVHEGLRRPEVMSQFPLLGRRRVGNWTLIKIGFPSADLERVIATLQAVLLKEPPYFANLFGGHDDQVLAVFPDRVFRLTPERSTWREAIQYGRDLGIPEHELVFGERNFGGVEEG